MPVDLKALAPEEAVAYFKAKGFALSPTFDWRDQWQQEHGGKFTVAKSAGFDILADVHAAVLVALQNGTTRTEFERNLIPTLQDKGWWGRAAAPDPQNPGQSPISQLGSPRRLKTIFDVNLRMAYAAGKWAQAERTKGTHPFTEYSAIMDDHTRPEHKAWNGTVVHMDDPWLDTHTPPCGWNCRCTLRQLSHADVADEGLTVSTPAPPETVTYTNTRTGEVTEVPKGIDPGFGYNPGKVAVDLHAARVAASKWVAAPPPLAAAAQAESVKFMLGALTQDFGQWVAKIDKTGHTIGDRRVIGALSQDVLDFLERKGASPASGALTVEDSSVAHFRSDRHVQGVFRPDGTMKKPPTAPSLADIGRLPDLMAKPERVLWDKVHHNLLYVFSPSGTDPRLGKIALEVNWTETKASGLFTNAVLHDSLVNPVALDNTGTYEEVPFKK
jgi:SPP1 gp7 family putative phage head morphogenesis protein